MGDSPPHPGGLYAPEAVSASSRPQEMPARVVLVDCYANSNVFVGDEGFRALATQLRVDGAETVLLDLVRDEPPPGKAMEDVLAAIRAASPVFLIVSRAWNAGLVEALRAAAGTGARIVRHSR